jgi:hypothetical protein
MSTKSQQKPQNKKKNKNKGKQPIKPRPNTTRMELGSTAASYEVSLRNPTKFEITSGKSPSHNEYGLGIRVQGRQQLALVSTTNANSNIFASGIASTSANSVSITPYAMNDRVAQFSAMYQRYVFRKILFTYITRVATTQAGSMVMAYNSDGGALTASTEVAPTYGTCQDVSPCVVFPFRKERETLLMEYSGERTWMVAYDVNANATPEAFRQCIQGILQGFPDITSIGTLNMGEIYIDYTLDLYAPTLINTNITLVNSIDIETRKLLVLLQKKFNKMEPPERKLQVAKINTLLASFI